MCSSDLFTLLNGVEADQEGGVLFRNDFVIFDEAHMVEQAAAKHIGVSVSSGQLRYNLQRLWNPKTQKGLLTTIRGGEVVEHVSTALERADVFFDDQKAHCEPASERVPTGHVPHGIANR